MFRFTIRDVLSSWGLSWPWRRVTRANIRRQCKWFTKSGLLDAAHYTAKYGLGEPPTDDEILSAPDERLPALGGTLHTDIPGGEPSTFFRCLLFIRGQGYRVSVTPEIWESLPEDEFEVPF